MSLPVEILDHILAFLQSDEVTLKACSKSHPSLSRLVERHLYANVTILDRQADSSDHFRKVLHDHPHVVNYVRTLSIVFDGVGVEAFLDGISVILPKFSKLRSIGLCNTDFLIDWATLTEKFCFAFLDCLRLPSLTDICMNSIAFPLSALSPCKYIRKLTLRGCATSTAAGSDDICLPAIDSLALHRCNVDFLSTIASWIQSRQLSSLAFSSTIWESSPLKSLPQILICCSHSLTSLDVNIGDAYSSHYDLQGSLSTPLHPAEAIPIPFSSLPNLQQLTVYAQLWCMEENGSFGFDSPIFAIADVLRPASSLKQLTLGFNFLISPHDYSAVRHSITEVLCTALHSLLVHSASPIGPINLCVDSFKLSTGIILSILAGHPDLMPFVEDGKLILTSANEDDDNRYPRSSP